MPSRTANRAASRPLRAKQGIEPARLSETPLRSPESVTAMWPGRTITLGGVDLHVRSTPTSNPDAEPALFVHGLGGSAHNWTDFSGVLADHLAIEAVDLPGFGRSGAAHDGDYSLRGQARTVINYLDHSARGPVHLVGNSMGGAISIQVAALRPDLIRTLTLISPAVPDVKVRVHPLRTDPRMALLILPGIGEAALKRMRTIDIRTRVKATIGICFADPSRYPQIRMDEAIAEGTARLRLPWAEQAMLRATRGLVRSQFGQRAATWTAMRSISVPSLVLWGDKDRLVAADLAPIVAATIPDARLRIFEDIGHTAMMEDPTLTARAMLGFIEDVRAGG